MTRYQFVVLSNPKPGREDDYNDWYSSVHIPEVLAIPGLGSARRLQLLDDLGDHPYRYLALYEIETEDIAAVRAALDDTSHRTGTDSLDRGRTVSWLYEVFEEQSIP